MRHLVSQAGAQRPGHSVLLAKMAEALFIESLRRYMEEPEGKSIYVAVSGVV